MDKTAKQNLSYYATSLFSSSVIKELTQGKKPVKFQAILKESGILSLKGFTSSMSIGDFYQKIFSLISKDSYRSEYTFKNILIKNILLGRHSLNTATVLDEFRVANSKLDIGIVNGTLTAYEIKTEKDSLDRLNNQLSDYQKFFEVVNVLTCERHAEKVLQSTSSSIGVLLLSDRQSISEVRKATPSREHLCKDTIFSSLRLSEIEALFEKCEIELDKEVPNGLKYQEYFKMFTKVYEANDFYSHLIEVIRESRSLKTRSELINNFPKELLYFGCSEKFGHKALNQLLFNIDNLSVMATNER